MTGKLSDYQQVLEQHRELKCLLGKIDAALQERSASIEEVGGLLGQLGDRLIRHFALEEAGGYFADALIHSPQLVGKANDLLAQHPKFRSLAGEMMEGLQTAWGRSDWWEKTTQAFAAFKQELLKHERSEDRLLQDAYSRDLGSHD